MNLIPEDVLDKIFKYKHELEFKDVLKELIQHKINCRYNISIGMLTYMFYLNEEGIRIPTIAVNDIEVFSFEILDRIRSSIFFFFFFIYKHDGS
jgi:hypothetical protein